MSNGNYCATCFAGLVCAWEFLKNEALVRLSDGRGSGIWKLCMCCMVSSLGSTHWAASSDGNSSQTNQVQREGCLILSISCLISNAGEMSDGVNQSDKLRNISFFLWALFLSLSFTLVGLILPVTDKEWLHPSCSLLALSQSNPSIQPGVTVWSRMPSKEWAKKYTSLSEGGHF